MDLLKKIFPIGTKFTGTQKNFIIGMIIHFALLLVCTALMFVPALGVILMYYVMFSAMMMLFIQFNVFGENDTFGDMCRKAFPLSYKYAADKDSFVNAILGYVAVWLLTPFAIYGIAGLILLIVEYCKNNKAAKVDAE